MIPNRIGTCAISTLLAMASAPAQSLCNDFHVPPAHIGHVQGCVFGANNTSTITLTAPGVLEWQRGFRIAPGQHLRFELVGAQGGAAVLNRDLSRGPSNIAGILSSNARVLLVNPAGNIAIQSGGLVDVAGGFLASTLDSPDDGILLGGGDAQFDGNPLSAIDNRGTLRSAGGDIVLISGSVNNFASGQILTPGGGIHIAAGSSVRLAAAGEPRITVLEGPGIHVISNSGRIEAGGDIGLAAFNREPALAGQRDPSIANYGIIRTTSPSGRVFLQTTNSGQVLNARGAEIDSQAVAIDGFVINEGAILEPDDGSNPAAPSGNRQFPRLTTGALTETPNSDFRLSRLSFSHLNGLESKTGKKTRVQKITRQSSEASSVRGASNANSSTLKKPAPKKKVIIRRGTFFGKSTG